MKIILHIGPPKTGTTAIQGALSQNRKALLEAGALYFTDPTDSPRALTTLYSDKNELVLALWRHFWSTKEANAWSERAWVRLASQVETKKPHTLIISSEHLGYVAFDFNSFMKRLSTIGTDVHVIAYVRDPASLYCSFIDQQIRGGQRLQELRTPWSYEYPDIIRIKRYLEAMGPQNMSVQAFDRKHLFKGDVIADFVEVLNGKLALGLPAIRFEGSQNSSLSGAAAALLMTMNETFERRRKDGADQNLVRRRAAFIKRLRQSETLNGLPRLALPDDALKSMIRHNASEKLAWFNDTFFGGKPVMDLGTPGAPAPDEAEQRAFMKDWILGYLDGEATRLAAQEVVN